MYLFSLLSARFLPLSRLILREVWAGNPRIVCEIREFCVKSGAGTEQQLGEGFDGPERGCREGTAKTAFLWPLFDVVLSGFLTFVTRFMFFLPLLGSFLGLFWDEDNNI